MYVDKLLVKKQLKTLALLNHSLNLIDAYSQYVFSISRSTLGLG